LGSSNTAVCRLQEFMYELWVFDPQEQPPTHGMAEGPGGPER